jgi:hypothetical protein
MSKDTVILYRGNNLTAQKVPPENRRLQKLKYCNIHRGLLPSKRGREEPIKFQGRHRNPVRLWTSHMEWKRKEILL